MYRIAGLITRLRARGWDITVLTVKKSSHEKMDPSTQAMIPDDVKVIRTRCPEVIGLARRLARARPGGAKPPSTPDEGEDNAAGQPLLTRLYRIAKLPFRWTYQALSYPDPQVGWIPIAAFHIVREARRGGAVVLSSTPPHTTQFAVRCARMLKRFRWVADFRDPWTAPLREPRYRLSLWFQRSMERSVIGACDRVIANTPGNRAALLAAFPHIDPAKVEVITNGFEPIDDRGPGARPEGPPDSDMVYFGELYPGMFDLYFAAIQEIRARRPELVPKLELYGLVHDEDVKRVERAGLDGHVFFRGTVTYRRSIELMRRARSLLLLLPPQERWATCVPSKMYAYLFAGRPVLVIAPPGDATRIVSETGVGVSLTSRDPAIIADGLADFVQAVRSGSFAASRSEESLRPYTMESIASKVEHTLLGENG